MAPEVRRGPSVAPAVLTGAAVVHACLIPCAPGLRDAGELGAAAHVVGVPHPTGFPLDMALLKAAECVPLGTVALRQSLVVSLVAAAALAALAHVTARVSERLGVSTGPAAVGGVVAAVGLGAWATFLSSAVTVEVYATASLLVLAGVAALLAHRDRLVYLLLGLSLGAHVSAVLGLVALAIVALERAPRAERGRRARAGLALVVLGASVVAWLPLSSARDPVVDWGDPETAGRLVEHLTAARIRAAFDVGMRPAMAHAARLGEQLGELWPLALPMLFGAHRLVRGSPRVAVVWAALLAVDLLYATAVNPMGVADRQVGHLAGAALTGLGGIGVASLVDAAWSRRGRRAVALSCACALGVASVRIAPPVAVDPDGPFELLGSGGAIADLPPRSVLVCATDDACAGAMFALHVDGVRPDVDVVPAQHLWEPSVRARLVPTVPALSALAGERPARPEARAALSGRALTLLLGGPRPVALESTQALSVVGVAADVAPGVAPYVVVDRRLATPPAEALERLEARLSARLSARQPARPRLPALARAWSRAFDTIGSAALAGGEADVARAAFERAVTLAPDRAAAWTNLGVAHGSLGDAPAAIEATVEALERDPRRPSAWANLVRFLAASGDLDGARRALDEAAAAGVRDGRLDELGERLP